MNEKEEQINPEPLTENIESPVKMPDALIQSGEMKLQEITQELDDLGIPEDIIQVQEEKEQEYNTKVSAIEEELGSLSEETKQTLRENIIDNSVEMSRENKQRFNELLEDKATLNVAGLFDETEKEASERLFKLKEIMGIEDYQISLEILKNNQDLFNIKGKLLHATNSFALEDIAENGVLSGGLRQKGPSFSNGGSESALTFNLIWEDLKTRKGSSLEDNPKKINSDKYFSKKDEFVATKIQELKENSLDEKDFERKKQELTKEADQYYKESWDVYKSEEEFDKDLSDKLYESNSEWEKQKLSKEEIETRKNEILKRAEIFKKQLCHRPSEAEINDMCPVTLIVNQEDLPEIHQDELSDLQKTFEVRPGGEVDFNKVSTIFVPFDKINEIRENLKDNYPNIMIRPSEELEIIRVLEKV